MLPNLLDVASSEPGDVRGFGQLPLGKGPGPSIHPHNMRLASEGTLKDPLSILESAMPHGLGVTIIW